MVAKTDKAPSALESLKKAAKKVEAAADAKALGKAEAAAEKAKKAREKFDAAQKKAAEKKVAKEAKDAERAKVKEAKDAAKAAQAAVTLAETERKLAPLAKEINVRMEKAAKLDGDADDHRLAAALRMKDAADVCKTAGVNFEEWCVKNVPTHAYNTIRLLVGVARKPDPKLALADMRKGNAEANKKHRAAKKTEKGSASTVEREGKTSKPKTAFKQAEDALAALDEKTALELVTSKAKAVGMSVVSKTDADAMKQDKKAAKLGDLVAMQAGFNSLSNLDKMEFLNWAADEIGFKVSNPLKETVGDPADPLAIPPALRRTKAAKA